MPLSPDLEGTRYATVRRVLDEPTVRAFASAVGHTAGGVPPTIVTIPEIVAGLGHVVDDPALGIDLANVLHAEQEYEWSRPLQVGEALEASSVIERIRRRGDITVVTLRTEVRVEDGEPVVVGRSTLIVRGGPT